MSSRHAWIRRDRSSASGASDSLWPVCLALRRSLAAGVKPAFPPGLVVQVKALACELPHRLGLPLSRLSIEEIRQHVISQGLVAEISGATLWRWLSSDALRPWQHRSWIFPRDPNFAAKAGPILDLYHRVWEGSHWAPTNLSSRPMKRRAFKPDARNNRLCLPVRTAPPELNTSTFAGVPGSTWRLGTSTAPRSSVDASSRMASRRWIASLAKS